MSNLITLTCPSCGGRLEITNNTERYVCVHCGNAHLIDPSERVDSLMNEVEILKYDERIRKAEAELASLVARQRRDWQTLETAEAQLAEYRTKKITGLLTSGVGAVLILIGLAYQPLGVMILGGAAFGIIGLREFTVNDFEARTARESATRQIDATHNAMSQQQRLLAQYRADQLKLHRQVPERTPSNNQ